MVDGEWEDGNVLAVELVGMWDIVFHFRTVVVYLVSGV
jgi:hypothetical protein